MRLIDADELGDFITRHEDDFLYALKHKDRGLLETMIALFPTAYNVDRVVEQLEEWTFNADVNLGDGTVKNSDLIASENAIEIVKAGGKDDKY